MDGRSDISPQPPGPAAIPELDTLDRAGVDPRTIEGISTVPDLRPVILVVDDELDVGRILQRILQDLVPDYDIITTTDPTDAPARIRGRTVPLMITDFLMPAMNGVDLAMYIKRRAPETQVLLITAYATWTLEQQVQHRGIEYYLPKPFAFADLERILDMALHADEPRG